MLIVTANRQDEIAQALVSRWAPYGAGLLTCVDLSTRGWRHRLSSTAGAAAVVGGQVVAVEEITGVYTRLPCIFEEELTHIVPEERSYVAAEMTAFLLSWLSSLRCPVINRPTPTCLAGPYWRKGQWIFAAARVGIPVRPLLQQTRSAVEASPEETTGAQAVTVTVVNDRCFGNVDKALADQARRLATFACVDLLAVQFSGPEPGAYFVRADVWPELAADEVEDAVLSYLQGKEKT